MGSILHNTHNTYIPKNNLKKVANKFGNLENNIYICIVKLINHLKTNYYE